MARLSQGRPPMPLSRMLYWVERSTVTLNVILDSGRTVRIERPTQMSAKDWKRVRECMADFSEPEIK